MQRWLPVVGYEGWYEVSDRGQVRSVDRYVQAGQIVRLYRSRVLPGTVTHKGYYEVSLSRDGRKRPFKVCRLVLLAFAGPPPLGQEACHGPGGSLDDRWPENLRWDTHEENMRDRVRHGTHYQLNNTHCRRRHLLQVPNLVPSGLPARKCRACHQAHSAIDRARRAGRPLPDLQTLSDQYYAKIISSA